MSVDRREFTPESFTVHTLRNVASYEVLDRSLVDGIVECVIASGMDTTPEDTLGHIGGDLVLAYQDNKTGKIAAFSSTKLLSPNQQFNTDTISDEVACYFAGATVAQDWQKSDVYKLMSRQRLAFGLENGMDTVFTQTQNKKILLGIQSILRDAVLRGVIGGFDTRRLLRPGAYGIDKPLASTTLPFEELDYTKGDAFMFTFPLQVGNPK